MQDITQLKTKNFQHKRNTIGEIVLDDNDIAQCIKTICTTKKGSVPFAPEFGCDVFEAIGENPQASIDFLKTVFLKEIPKQEPRCQVTDVTGAFDDNGKIVMIVYFKKKSDNLTSKVEVYYD